MAETPTAVEISFTGHQWPAVEGRSDEVRISASYVVLAPILGQRYGATAGLRTPVEAFVYGLSRSLGLDQYGFPLP